MGRSFVLAGVAVLGVALVAAFLWKGLQGSEGSSAVQASRTADVTRPQPVGPLTPVETPPRPATSDATIEATPSRVDERVEVAQPELTANADPAADTGIELLVVDASGLPMQGVEVLTLATSEDDHFERFHDHERVDELLETLGQRQLTPASGIVRVPRPDEDQTLVVARAPGRWSSRRFHPERPPEEEPVELELQIDQNVRAKVVDQMDEPVAGAMVKFARKDRWGSWAAQRAETKGPDGIATLRHVHEHFGGDRPHQWVVGLDVLFEEPIEVDVDQDDLPQEPVKLVLPTAGSVDVHVFDEDGEPYRGEAEATLGIIREGEPERLSPFSDIRRPSIDRPVEDGVAHFALVETGRDLEVAVTRPGARIATRTYGAGPNRTGDQRRFDLRLGTDHPVAQLRVIDEARRPLSDELLTVNVVVSGRFTNNSTPIPVTTDDEGYVRVDLEGGWSEDSQRELLVVQGPREAPRASARVDVSRRLESGLNDLGTIQLAPAPLFVRGQVVDSLGQPVPEAKLTLAARSEERNYWRQDWRFKEYSDDDGTFEVRGIFAGDEFQVGAQKTGLTGTMVSFAPGTDGLVIQLRSEGRLAGSVLFDPGFPAADQLELELKGNIDHLLYNQRRATPDEEGLFEFKGLLEGEYSIEIGFDDHGESLQTIEGIRIVEGRENRDPRLDPLDLRGLFHAHRVTIVLDEESNQRLQGDARFDETGAEELEQYGWFYDQEFWLISDHERIDLELAVGGYRPVRLENVGDKIEARLTPAPTVRIALASDIELPEPPVFVKAVLAPEESNHHALDWGAAAFDEDREITVQVPGTGPMEVVWILERRSSGGSSAWTVQIDPPVKVVVEDVLDQRIELNLTAEQQAQLFEDS